MRRRPKQLARYVQAIAMSNLKGLLNAVGIDPSAKRAAPSRWFGFGGPATLETVHRGIPSPGFSPKRRIWRTSKYVPHQSTQEKDRRIQQGLAGRSMK